MTATNDLLSAEMLNEERAYAIGTYDALQTDRDGTVTTHS